MVALPEQRCMNCKFWMKRKPDPANAGIMKKPPSEGACRRYPPSMQSQAVPLFPVTLPATWCGEWIQSGTVHHK